LGILFVFTNEAFTNIHYKTGRWFRLAGMQKVVMDPSSKILAEKKCTYNGRVGYKGKPNPAKYPFKNN